MKKQTNLSEQILNTIKIDYTMWLVRRRNGLLMLCEYMPHLYEWGSIREWLRPLNYIMLGSDLFPEVTFDNPLEVELKIKQK